MLRKHGNKALTQPMSYSQGTGLRAIVNHESICSAPARQVDVLPTTCEPAGRSSPQSTFRSPPRPHCVDIPVYLREQTFYETFPEGSPA
jgi:hypothetical protein